MILAVSTAGLLHISQLVFLVLNWRKGTYSLTRGKWDYVGLKETWYVMYTVTLWINWETFLMMQEFGLKLALSAIPLFSTYPSTTSHFIQHICYPEYTDISWLPECRNKPVDLSFVISFNLFIYMHEPVLQDKTYTRYIYTIHTTHTHTSFQCLAQSLTSSQ